MFLVRGLCQTCAPTIHGNYRRAYDASTAMFDRFERERGVSALSAWYDFETWLEQQPDFEEYTQILAQDSRP